MCRVFEVLRNAVPEAELLKSVRPGQLAVRHVTLTVAKHAPQVLDEILELKMIDMELDKNNTTTKTVLVELLNE